jgi:transposase, IS30 family
MLGVGRWPWIESAVRYRFWDLRGSGVSVPDAASSVGVGVTTAQKWVREHGGVRPRPPSPPSGRYLSVAEREVIYEMRIAGATMRAIAAVLGRAPSTVSRELKRNSDYLAKYRPHAAERAARLRARRPKPAKLAVNAALREQVQKLLTDKLSPEQISATLKQTYPDCSEMHVSYETIYQSLYVQARGGLKRELVQHLRTGRALRKVQRRSDERRGRIPDMVNISQRPAEVADRAVPGHWEGDLIIGKNNGSAIGTLVERTTRFVMLLPLQDGFDAIAVRDAMIAAVAELPAALKKSVTWDQGREMSRHAEITMATAMQVYFCDPHSPWQRGTNENTNGLLRQYFPKGTTLSVHSVERLREVALQLNQRPRKTLDWQTPQERLNKLLDVASTA